MVCEMTNRQLPRRQAKKNTFSLQNSSVRIVARVGRGCASARIGMFLSLTLLTPSLTSSPQNSPTDDNKNDQYNL